MGDALSQDERCGVATVETVKDWTLMGLRKWHSQGTADRFRPEGGVPCSHIKRHSSRSQIGGDCIHHTKTFGVKPENRADKTRVCPGTCSLLLLWRHGPRFKIVFCLCRLR